MYTSYLNIRRGSYGFIRIEPTVPMACPSGYWYSSSCYNRFDIGNSLDSSACNMDTITTSSCSFYIWGYDSRYKSYYSSNSWRRTYYLYIYHRQTVRYSYTSFFNLRLTLTPSIRRNFWTQSIQLPSVLVSTLFYYCVELLFSKQ